MSRKALKFEREKKVPNVTPKSPLLEPKSIPKTAEDRTEKQRKKRSPK